MYGFFSLIVLIAFICLVGGPILAAVAMSRARGLERRVGALETRLGTLERGADRPAPDTVVEEPETPAAVESEPVPEPEPEPEEPLIAAPAPEPVEVPAAAAAAPVARRSLEELFASQWLVWLGGLTIALAGIFLVKYGIEHELLSPTVRVILAFVLGVCLVCGGEWLRQRPLQRAIASVSPDYVPPSLTGAGVLICFGSVYAGYVLLGLLSPLVVFVLLAAIAVGAMALSLLQGPFIAVLGILGAFSVPALVSTGSDSAWALFSYLLIVAASAFAVVRFRQWWWLAFLTLLGATLWDGLWLVAMWRAGDLIPTAIHLLAMFAMAMAVRYEDFAAPRTPLLQPFGFAELSDHESFVAAAGAVLAAMTFAVVRIDGYGTESLIVGGVVMVLLTGIAWRLRRLELLASIAACLPVLLLVSWHIPDLVTLPEKITLGGRELGALPAPIVPPEFAEFSIVAGLAALWFGIVGYAAIARSRPPAYWATISAAVPILVLSIVYWRMAEVGVDLAWAAVAMGLACAATAAAVRIGNRPQSRALDEALGIYALAVIAAISLAATMTLENAWLTVALAVQLPAAAWVHNRFNIAMLRPVSFVIAAVVGARLVLAHQLPGISWGVPRDPVWILYGYGIPAAAFAIAAHWFRRTGDDRLVLTLESCAIATAVATVSMEIRQFVGEPITRYWRYTLLEQSLHSVSWLASGYGLYRRCRVDRRLSYEWGAKILIGMAALQIVFLQVLYSNPILTGESVGTWPLVDVMALAYLLPAALAGLIFFEAKRQGHANVAIGAGIAVGLLLFCYITMEVRHIFHGARLDRGAIGDAEGYAYSVAWLLYAAALFAIGFLWRVAAIRHAALALTMLIVAKVFLWDMSGLTGLYRVASFLGLGLSLVAIGYFYQRFMFAGRAAPEAAEATE